MSRPPVEEPVTVVGDRGQTITTHPAFGQVSVSRIYGSQPLYDSDFHHHNFIKLAIRRSELHRDLSHDWHFARQDLIEVAMSEAQWATVVSSLNMGSGVPCTIEHVMCQMMPRLPPPASRADQFSNEIEAQLARSIEEVKCAIAEVDELGLSKAKADKIKYRLNNSLRALTSSTPFVAEQFSKHVENTVEKGKAEIHGYMASAIQRAGLEALNGGQLPLQIAAPGDRQED